MDTIFELEKKVNRVVFRKSSVTPIAGGRRERERESASERACGREGTVEIGEGGENSKKTRNYKIRHET